MQVSTQSEPPPASSSSVGTNPQFNAFWLGASHTRKVRFDARWQVETGPESISERHYVGWFCSPGADLDIHHSGLVNHID
jgi:hypothetical protein